jgi:hypothetical protein
MALSNSIAAYSDCYDHFDRANNSANGIRILLSTEKEANYLRFRLNQARALERRDSMRVYDKIDHRFGKSENDRFRISVIPAAEGEIGFWVYIQPWVQEVEEIEEL